MYPTVEFVSRLWAIYLFLMEILSLLACATFMLKGLVEFLLPNLEFCSTFQNEIARPEGDNRDMITIILKKFLKPILSNKKLHSILNN